VENRLRKRIVYIQYANPACYPALEHSSQILADNDWKVIFLGTESFGTTNALRLSPHANIEIKKLSFYKSQWLQKAHYISFCVWTILRVLKWRPEWVYLSDPLSCPIGLVLSYFRGIKIIYHEHDSPGSQKSEKGAIFSFAQLKLYARIRLARRSKIAILPNRERLKRFMDETGKEDNVFCIWNCPRLKEMKTLEKPETGQEINLYFHGNIHEEHLPINILEAMASLPGQLNLKIIGYESLGARGYVEQFKKAASRLGVGDRVEFFDAVSRHSLLKHCVSSDIGLAFISKNDKDVNNRHRVGASNKPFEYLACGLPVVVSDLPDWQKMYVAPGYGVACNMNDSGSIAKALSWFLKNPEQIRVMGEKGKRRITEEWNYEMQFAPVEKLLNKK